MKEIEVSFEHIKNCETIADLIKLDQEVRNEF
jgi:acyl carrier protein